MRQAVPCIEVIERFQGSAPVDVTKLAEALGLRVWEDSDLPEGISGKLFRDPVNGGTEGYSIVVRASDPYVRRRFTVAHEIAHFLLHRKQLGGSLTDDKWYRSILSNREEAEANSLAAEILMPLKLIQHYARNLGLDPAVLGRAFKVSEAAMRIRLGMRHVTVGA